MRWPGPYSNELLLRNRLGLRSLCGLRFRSPASLSLSLRSCRERLILDSQRTLNGAGNGENWGPTLGIGLCRFIDSKFNFLTFGDAEV